MDGSVFQDSFWASSPFKNNDEAEMGIAALAKGNFVTAEGHFQKALRANPRDIDALLGAGILYQNTGQMTKAREMYEAVLALRPEDSEQFVTWSSLTTRPASQVASVNLSLLESGGTGQAMAASAPGTMPGVSTVPLPGSGGVMGAPSGNVMLGRSAPTQMASAPTSGAGAMAEPMTIATFSGGDGNIVSRFATMKALRDQGLVTQEEFAQRRRSNLGALLPLTAPPPAAGLDRPVPTTDQISARLRAIGRALEMRAISVSQHAAERNMILDALMPSAPVVVANPAAPPKGLMEGADAVRRLEQLKDNGYVSSDEYARERQAIELAVQSTPTAGPAKPGAAAAPVEQAPKQMSEAKPAKPSGPQPAVHLASYKSEKQAMNGWTQIKRAHAKVLGNKQPEITKVDLGRKGTYFRLKVGPFGSGDEAKKICDQLKRARQYCDPTVMGAG